MGTVVVDLPAHNTWASVAGTPATEIGTGHEVLADADETTGFSLSATTGGVYVGATSAASGGGFANGFGLFDLPAGATLVDARFVAHMDVSSFGVVPPGSYSTGGFVPTPVRYPTLAVEFNVGGTLGRYTLDAPSSGTPQVEVVGSPITHLIGGADYVIDGIGTPDTGTYGLCPLVYISDSWWQFPLQNHPVFVSYLAVRVTYTTSGTAPLRRHPVTHRLYPPQPTRRQAGGYR